MECVPEDAFRNGTLWCLADEVKVHVSYGHKSEDWAKHRQDALDLCKHTAEPIPRLRAEVPISNDSGRADYAEYYTYFALLLGTVFVWMGKKWYKLSSKRHHITLAYLPWQEWSRQEKLLKRSWDLFGIWFKWMPDPLGRPIESLSLRQCVVPGDGGPGIKEIYQPIAELSVDEFRAADSANL